MIHGKQDLARLHGDAIIVRILKKVKPASQIDSSRTVSLTSCVAKTMERMVATASPSWQSPMSDGARTRMVFGPSVHARTKSSDSAKQSTMDSRLDPLSAASSHYWTTVRRMTRYGGIACLC